MVLRQSPVPLNMLFQQMKSMRSLKIEETNGTRPTPSITVANTDKTPNESSTVRSRLKYYREVHSLTTNEDSNCYLPSVNLPKKHTTFRSQLKYYFEEPLAATHVTYDSNYLSQSTRFSFGTKIGNVTLLKRLCYTYSYIYNFAILIFVVILFMPSTTTISVPLNTGIVSPEPRTSKRSFAMSNYTSITEVFFKFVPHCTPKLRDVHTALNHAYSEPFPDDTVASLFSDPNRTTIDPDALTTIRTKIVDLIHAASNTDRITVATIIDQLPLSTYCGKPPRRVPIRGPAGIKSAFNQQLASNCNDFVLDFWTRL